jgi:hypothetical protein
MFRHWIAPVWGCISEFENFSPRRTDAAENQNGSDSQSDNPEIFHELFHLASKYAHFIFGDWAYLDTRDYASLYEAFLTLDVN